MTINIDQVTASRAYRIHAEGRLIGFVWRQYGQNAWMHSLSTDVFPAQRTAIEALLRAADQSAP